MFREGFFPIVAGAGCFVDILLAVRFIAPGLGLPSVALYDNTSYVEHVLVNITFPSPMVK